MTRDEAIITASDDASHSGTFEEFAQTFLASLAASGYAVVPAEATEKMLVRAGATPKGVMPRGGIDRMRALLPKYWRAMLAAAQEENG